MRTPTPGNGAGVRVATWPVHGARRGRQGGWLDRGFGCLQAGFRAAFVSACDFGEIDELLVDLVQLGLDHHVVGLLADREVLEDGEVEQAALGLGGFVVGHVVAIDQRQCFVEGSHDVIDLVSGGLRPVLDLCSLLFDTRLFSFQHVFGDGVAVEELDELLLLGGQFAQPASMALAFAPSYQRLLLDGRAHGAPDVLAFVGAQPVVGVDVVETFLDDGEAHVTGAAGPAGRDPAEAGVVLVLDAQLAAVAAVAVALAAGAADDLAGEIVVVLAAAAAASPVAVEHGLGAVEGVLADERFVAAGLLDAAVGDDAEVVVVSEHPVHGGHAQRLGWA